ncbi:hypothetical protein BRADI_2g31865v3 [Brachypodium distachyon]|uniref:Uncharacterized protein n=1 Tax=Brachypodium distachyon TaxID=15368 RepID=A0A2K2DBD1_BRADI|nr:hypothetical protein BRADI_2g31865v3 [Brachypodium distachyon]
MFMKLGWTESLSSGKSIFMTCMWRFWMFPTDLKEGLERKVICREPWRNEKLGSDGRKGRREITVILKPYFYHGGSHLTRYLVLVTLDWSGNSNLALLPNTVLLAYLVFAHCGSLTVGDKNRLLRSWFFCLRT